MRGEFIDVEGCRLYYYAAGTRGQGDPIVLIHGIPSTGHLWSNLVPLLPQGRRVVVPDLLGFGRSDYGVEADLSISGHAGRLICLLDALRIGRASLVGHHLGALVASSVAVAQPERVGHLAMLHPVGGDATFTGSMAVLRAFDPAVRLLPAGLLVRSVRRQLFKWFADEVRAKHSVELYALAISGPGRWTGFLEQLRQITPMDVMECTKALALLRVPCAVVAGESDRAVPDAAIAAVRASIPNSTLDIIADGYHFTPEECPEQLARILAGLLGR